MKRSPFLWTCALAAVLLLLIASSAPEAGRVALKPGSRVLVADVQNETGQAGPGLRLKQLLNLALDQSSHINLYSESESRSLLQWVASSPQAPVTAGVALQICSREQIPVFLLPKLSSAGGSLIFSVRIFEVRNNRIARITPAGSLRASAEEGLLLSMADLGKRIRTILGEAPSSPAMSGDLFFQISHASGDALRCLAQSQVLALRKDEAGEIALLERAVKLAPGFALPQWRLVSLYAQQGRMQAATDLAEAAGRQSEALPPKLKYRTRAVRYYLEKKYSRALHEYGLLSSTFPEDWQAHWGMGNAALCLADYAMAVQEFGTAVRINDLQIESHLGLSIAELFSGNTIAARCAWERAQSIAPDDSRVLHTGAQIDLIDSNVASALVSLQKAEGSPLAPIRSLSSYLRAQVLIYGGRFQAALDTLEAGIEDDRLRGDTFSASKKQLARAQTLFLSGNAEGAIEECARISHAPADPAILAAIGILHARMGKKSEANEILAHVEKLRLPADAQAYRENFLGEIALASGSPHDAILAFKRARQLLPGHPPSEALARAFVQAGQPEEAAKEYQAVFERKVELLFPRDSPWFTGTWVRALFDASRCLLQMGNKAEAQQYLRNYLWALDGADASLPTIQEARTLLKGK